MRRKSLGTFEKPAPDPALFPLLLVRFKARRIREERAVQNAVRGSVRRSFGEKFASRGHDKISNMFDISLTASRGGISLQNFTAQERKRLSKLPCKGFSSALSSLVRRTLVGI